MPSIWHEYSFRDFAILIRNRANISAKGKEKVVYRGNERRVNNAAAIAWLDKSKSRGQSGKKKRAAGVRTSHSAKRFESNKSEFWWDRRRF